jgi:hypothetical protein
VPVFIDEIVFRGEIRPPAAASPAAPGAAQASGAERDALVSEVAQAVLDHLERTIERLEER